MPEIRNDAEMLGLTLEIMKKLLSKQTAISEEDANQFSMCADFLIQKQLDAEIDALNKA